LVTLQAEAGISFSLSRLENVYQRFSSFFFFLQAGKRCLRTVLGAEERLEKLKAKPVSNLFRIIVPIGKITLKEWTLIDSKTNF
jgi:hypothetical protein